jgi:hypothetical protein
MSTALWMLEERSNYEVTILEKSAVVPAPDAASTGEFCAMPAASRFQKYIAGEITSWFL